MLFSTTGIVSLFGAIVINIMMDVAVLAALNFGLGCNTAATGGTFHEAGKSKHSLLMSWAWLVASAHNLLDPIKFLFGNHWLMRSFIPIATVYRKLKPAIIKWVGEDAIDHRPGKRFAPEFSHRTRAKAPVVVSDLENPWRRMVPG